MKKTLAIVTTGLALLSSLQNDVFAQTYNADVTIDEKLFSSPGNLAPVNTIVWFVASTDSTLGTFSGNSVAPNQILGGDDTLLAQVKTDGSQFLGALGPGYLYETIENIPVANSSRTIFLVLWGNKQTTGTPNLVPADGDQFGFFSLGTRPWAGFGNADWSVTANVIGNTHLVVVPEPSTYLLSAMGLLAVVGYRRFRK